MTPRPHVDNRRLNLGHPCPFDIPGRLLPLHFDSNDESVQIRSLLSARHALSDHLTPTQTTSHTRSILSERLSGTPHCYPASTTTRPGLIPGLTTSHFRPGPHRMTVRSKPGLYVPNDSPDLPTLATARYKLVLLERHVYSGSFHADSDDTPCRIIPRRLRRLTVPDQIFTFRMTSRFRPVPADPGRADDPTRRQSNRTERRADPPHTK